MNGRCQPAYYYEWQDGLEWGKARGILGPSCGHFGETIVLLALSSLYLGPAWASWCHPEAPSSPGENREKKNGTRLGSSAAQQA